MARKKSIKDIVRQESRIQSNYAWNNPRMRQVREIRERMLKEALNRTKIGALMAELEEAEANLDIVGSKPSYANAAQKLSWLARNGNKDAEKAMNIKKAAVGLVNG